MSHRARQQAFYHRQRRTRILRRVARDLGAAFNEEMSGAWRDVLVHGIGWIEVSRPAGRTFFDASGAEVAPPDGSPRDGSIASMLSVRRVARDEWTGGELP